MKKLLRQQVPPCNKGGGVCGARGFTLIELIVAITIIVFLAGVLLNRIWFYQEQAEKTAMEQVAGAVQSALVLQYGSMLTSGRDSEAKILATENPTNWLMQKPQNYAGEYFGMTPSVIAPGNWAFDLKSRELIYVPYRTEYFVPGKDGFKWVRFRVRLEYDPVPGSKNLGTQTLVAVLFEPVEHYQWFVRGEK